MRSSISMVPLIGVLAVLFSVVAQDFKMVELQVPRALDGGCECDDPPTPTVRVALHPDWSADLSVDADTRQLDAPALLGAVRAIAMENQNSLVAIYLDPDESVTWQQVVEATSSLQHATDLHVALVTHESSGY